MTKQIFVEVILGKEEMFEKFLFCVIEQGEPLFANMLLESLSFAKGIPAALEFLLNQAILREDSPAVARFKEGEMATMESLFRSFQTILQRYRPQSHTPTDNALMQKLTLEYLIERFSFQQATQLNFNNVEILLAQAAALDDPVAKEWYEKEILKGDDSEAIYVRIAKSIFGIEKSKWSGKPLGKELGQLKEAFFDIAANPQIKEEVDTTLNYLQVILLEFFGLLLLKKIKYSDIKSCLDLLIFLNQAYTPTVDHAGMLKTMASLYENPQEAKERGHQKIDECRKAVAILTDVHEKIPLLLTAFYKATGLVDLEDPIGVDLALEIAAEVMETAGLKVKKLEAPIQLNINSN